MTKKRGKCEICGEKEYKDGLCISCYMELREEELKELEFMMYG